MLINKMTEEFQGGGAEHTLVWIKLDPVVLQPGENLTQMGLMFFRALAGDKNVIKVSVAA